MARKKHTAKWQALYKSTMKWQKKARAKERRLAAKGATNVSGVSPVKTPAELQNMTYAQLERYRHSLNVFSDVNTRFVITPDNHAVNARESVTLRSGEKLPWRRWQTLQNAVARVNKQRGTIQDALETAAVPPAYEHQRTYSTPRFDPYTGKPLTRTYEESVAGKVRGPSRLPKSLADFESMLGSYRGMAERGFDTTLKNARMNAIKIADLVGWNDVADELAHMPDNVLAFATEYLGLFDRLQEYYDDNMALGDPYAGYYSMKDADPDGWSSNEQTLLSDMRRWRSDLSGVKLPDM